MKTPPSRHDDPWGDERLCPTCGSWGCLINKPRVDPDRRYRASDFEPSFVSVPANPGIIRRIEIAPGTHIVEAIPGDGRSSREDMARVAKMLRAKSLEKAKERGTP